MLGSSILHEDICVWHHIRNKESISYSRQAKAEAEPTCPILYMYKIYHSLRYSLSRRAHVSRSHHADLGDAIVCCREVLRLEPRESVEYETPHTNPTMCLQVRYTRDHRTEDVEEAFTILNRQLERCSPWYTTAWACSCGQR